MYRWDDGDNFTRQRFVYWLTDLNDWYSRYTGNKGTDSNIRIEPLSLMRSYQQMGSVGAPPFAAAKAEAVA